MKNPLLQVFSTPFASAPFSKIKNEHFKPAFIEAIEFARAEIDMIASNSEAPTFENTIEKLEYSGQHLDRISSIFYNLNSAETSEEIQQLAQEISPLLTQFTNDIRLNEVLFSRIQAVYKSQSKLELDSEQKKLLEVNYKVFVRNGAHLSKDDKQSLRKIDTDLSKLKLHFGENVLADSNEFSLHLTDKAQLKGLPATAIEAAELTAQQKKVEGWVFTLDYPSYIPFMTYLEDRDLRMKMALAFGSRGFQKNKNNNESTVLDIVRLRHERANLLGYNSHAHFVLEERMAESPETVISFLNDLLEKAKPAAKIDFQKLTSLAKSDGIEQIEKWDAAYYSEKLKKELLDLDEEALRPYFKLENVIQGVFDITKKLYGLSFEAVDTVAIYHEDVKTFKVSDEHGKYIALLYADFFPRKGKRNGAWMTSFKGQWKVNSENSRPHISIVCNFTKPTKSTPSLLSFNEVTTLFHEFGHALHGMLADTTYRSLSGTNVHWDFVELPSQILENWCYEEKALKLFARHFETGKTIPMDLINKIKNASNFLEGMQTLRQLSFGLLDMKWHSKPHKEIKNVKTFEKEAFKNTAVYPDVETNCMSTAFSHIFQGGYAAGYYSYKWAEVLDADAFALFKSKGIFNKEIADRFKEHILTKGGTIEPMELYETFRGKKPSNKHLLKRAGLLK